jgi:hypothetical protein
MKIGLGDRGKGIVDNPNVPKKESKKIEKYKSTNVEKKK